MNTTLLVLHVCVYNIKSVQIVYINRDGCKLGDLEQRLVQCLKYSYQWFGRQIVYKLSISDFRTNCCSLPSYDLTTFEGIEFGVLILLFSSFSTWSKAGPKIGTMNPWYMKSSSCCLISGCATCTTALQNSKQFMNSVNFGISATSSGVMRYQSLCPISKLFGSDE